MFEPFPAKSHTFHFISQIFIEILLVDRVQASIQKEKTLKFEFPAKLHSLKLAKFAKQSLDMPNFANLQFSLSLIKFNGLLFTQLLNLWIFKCIIKFFSFSKSRINLIKAMFQINIEKKLVFKFSRRNKFCAGIVAPQHIRFW